MIAVGAADRRILPTPALLLLQPRQCQKIPTPTLVPPRAPVPPAISCCVLLLCFRKSLQYEPAFSIAIHTSILYSYRSTTPSSL